jgi:hypothetical protein
MRELVIFRAERNERSDGQPIHFGEFVEGELEARILFNRRGRRPLRWLARLTLAAGVILDRGRAGRLAGFFGKARSSRLLKLIDDRA